MPRSIPHASRHLPAGGFQSRFGKKDREINVDRLGPTPERLARAAEAGADAIDEAVTEIIDRAGNVERVATARLYDGDVLELLFRRKVIDQEQYACGKDFHRHWQCSGLASIGVVDPARERVDGGTHKPESETRLWHLGKWSQLVRRLGEVHSKVLCACVLLDETLQDYGVKNSRKADRKKAGEWAQGRLTGALEQLVIIMLGPKGVRGGSSMIAGARPVIPPAKDGD